MWPEVDNAPYSHIVFYGGDLGSIIVYLFLLCVEYIFSMLLLCILFVYQSAGDIYYTRIIYSSADLFTTYTMYNPADVR